MAARILRIGLMALAVLALEWRLAPPALIAGDPERSAIPLALLALMVPMVVGVWTFEVASPRAGLKTDLLWALLVGTACYASLSLVLF